MKSKTTVDTTIKQKQLTRFKMVKEKTGDGLAVSAEPIRTSDDLARIFQQIQLVEGDGIREMFVMLFMNRANIVTGYQIVSIGGVNGTLADSTLICRAALLNDCKSVAVNHNHPSGNLQPSRSDEQLTLRLKDALALIDVRLLDHIITTEENGYLSFADEGIV